MKSTLIEETAAQLAGAFFEEAKSQSIFDCSKYRDARHYAGQNFEKFIPKAIEHLQTILAGNYPESMKMPIYEALIERANFKPSLLKRMPTMGRTQ